MQFLKWHNDGHPICTESLLVSCAQLLMTSYHTLPFKQRCNVAPRAGTVEWMNICMQYVWVSPCVHIVVNTVLQLVMGKCTDQLVIGTYSACRRKHMHAHLAMEASSQALVPGEAVLWEGAPSTRLHVHACLPRAPFMSIRSSRSCISSRVWPSYCELAMRS